MQLGFEDLRAAFFMPRALLALQVQPLSQQSLYPNFQCSYHPAAMETVLLRENS